MTVFEREDKPGGLLRYGIPNMKLEKQIIDRKIEIMKEEGIEFRTGCDVGKEIKPSEILKIMTGLYLHVVHPIQEISKYRGGMQKEFTLR